MSEDAGDRGDREPPLIKNESSASGGPPPGLIPLVRPDTAAATMSAEKQQVSKFMRLLLTVYTIIIYYTSILFLS